MSSNHWNYDDLQDIFGRHSHDENERAAHLALVRKRLKTGFYLTEQAALQTASKMAHLFDDPLDPPAA